MTKYQQLFYNIKTSRDYKTVGENVDYKVIIDNKNKEIVLQYEESKQDSDWILNFAVIPWPLLLDKNLVWTTLGYAIAYSSCKNEPINLFEAEYKAHKDYKLIIQGWSFGSAMAKIAVRHFSIRCGKNILDEELTYGDVKVWINPFVHWLSKNWVKVRHNFTYINDLVTWCVPLFFRHNKNKVGDKFNIKKIFNTEYNHTHYEEYDYSDYEKETV